MSDNYHNDDIVEVTLSVEGMSCQACVRNIEAKLRPVHGIISVDVNLVDASCRARIHPPIISPEILVERIEDLGFDAELVSSASIPVEALALERAQEAAREYKSAVETPNYRSARNEDVVANMMMSATTPQSNSRFPTTRLPSRNKRKPTTAFVTFFTELAFAEKGNFEIHPRPSNSERVILLLPNNSTDERKTQIKSNLQKTNGVVSATIRSLRFQNPPKYQNCSKFGISIIYNPNIIGVRKLLTIVRIDDSNQNSPVTYQKNYSVVDLKYDQVQGGSIQIDSIYYTPFELRGLRYPKDIEQCSFLDKDLERSIVDPKELESAADSAYKSSKFAMQLSILPCIFVLGLHEFAMNWWPIDGRISLSQILQIISCVFVVYYCGFQFHRKGLRCLRNRSLTMDVMVSLNSSICVVYSITLSILTMLYPENAENYTGHFYSTATLLMTVLLIGRVIEMRAKRRAQSEVDELQVSTSNHQVNVLISTSGENSLLDELSKSQQVLSPRSYRWSSSLLHIGDIVGLNEGEIVPADGFIISASSSVSFDESVLTGDSNRIGKSVGSQIFACSKITNGQCLFVVTNVQSSTMIGEVINSVKEVNEDKIGLQKTADDLASVFIPVVTLFALLTFGLWFSFVKFKLLKFPPEGTPFGVGLRFAVAVLAMACPCAIGLATPIVISVASTQCHKLGLLLKNATAMERVHLLKYIVIDKTGTLTDAPVFSDHWFDYNTSSNPILSIARSTKLYHKIASTKFVEKTSTNNDGSSSPTEQLTKNEHPLDSIFMWIITKLAEDGMRPAAVLHPFASAIVGEARSVLKTKSKTCSRDSSIVDFDYADCIRVKNYTEIPGTGALCSIELATNDNNRTCVFDVQVRKALNVESHASINLQNWMTQNFESGRSVSLINIKPEMELEFTTISAISVQTPLNKNAVKFVQRLQNIRDFDVILCTGDHRKAAESVARQLGIRPSRIVADCRPADKAVLVRGLQMAYRDAQSLLATAAHENAFYRKEPICPDVSRLFDNVLMSKRHQLSDSPPGVMFIGDGLNDAGALGCASVGVSFGCGIEPSVPFADLVVVSKDLTTIDSFMSLSINAMRTVQRNYLWALLFNGIGLPFAAGFGYPYVVLPPWFCAFLMSVSSVGVVMNSQRTSVSNEKSIIWNIRKACRKLMWWRRHASY